MLNTRERFIRTLTGQETDRVPFIKVFGGDNAVLPRWRSEKPGIEKNIDEILKFEGGYRGWRTTPVNFWLCGEIKQEVIAEDDETRTIKYEHGQVTIHRKDGDYHWHIAEYPVKDAGSWYNIKEKYLNPYDKQRIPHDFDKYIELYKTRDFPLQLTCGGVYGFIRNLMGDEALCYAVYDDPELVEDIMTTYINMNIKLWEVLCRDIKFDLIECWEDMASKNGSMISPATFERFMAPHYRKIKSFADAYNIPIILVDSDGYTDKLAEQMASCGVNAMYPFEVGAGCDTIAVLDKLPNMAAIGCLEKNSCSEGKEAVDKQMLIAEKLIKHGRCIPGPDHFVLNNTSFEQYKYFMNRLRDVIMSTKPGA